LRQWGITLRGDQTGKRNQLGAKRRTGDFVGAFDQLKALLRPRRMSQSPVTTEDHIRSILIVRRARDETFGAHLFAEPAWDVLLELYAATLGGRPMKLRDIALAISVPASTTARWIAALAERGLIASHADPNEPDVPNIGLTERGAAQMKQLADHWRDAFLSI
jgi:DNA-binding MarR family transcriptional regulator